MGYTYDELLKMGATPTDTAPTQKKKYTYEELTAMGAKPTQPTQTTQPVQPSEDKALGLLIGAGKGAGSTLESGLRSVGQIAGGIGGAISVPIQERQQADLVTQYKQALQDKNPALAKQIYNQINQAGTMSRQAQWLFDNPLLAKAREALTPKTTAEKIGYGGEKIGEMFIPAGLIQKASKNTGLLGRAITSGIGTGSVKLAQTGVGPERKDVINDTLNAVKTGATTAAFSAGTELALAGISKFLKSAGSKIQWGAIKPSQADVKDGFKIDNIEKHQLGGTLNETLIKSNDKLKNYREQLQTVLKKSDGQVNLNKVFSDVNDELMKARIKNIGSNKQLQNAFQDLYDDVVDIVGKSKVDLSTANDLKIGAGAQGAWQFGKFDPDSKAKETVYNIFYNKIKNAIEQSSGSDQVKNINKAMSEIIPIQRAVIRRIPIVQRQNPLGLLEGISLIEALSSGNPRGLSVLGAKAITGSAKAGAAFKDIGTLAEKVKEPAAGLLSKFIAGLKK